MFYSPNFVSCLVAIFWVSFECTKARATLESRGGDQRGGRVGLSSLGAYLPQIDSVFMSSLRICHNSELCGQGLVVGDLVCKGLAVRAWRWSLDSRT